MKPSETARHALTKRDRDRLLASLFLSPREAALLLPVSRGTIYRMIRKGEAPYERISGRIFIPVWWIRQKAGLDERETA
jgi:excisionase family DNA binding protein